MPIRYITPDFYDTGIDLFYKGVALPQVQAFQNTIYVNKAGDNAKAQKGRIDKPFTTFTAALAVAVDGDTIIGYSGTYDEKLSIPTLYNLTFILHDVKLTYSVASADPAIFIANTRLNIIALGKCSITRTNQTAGYAVTCSGNATINFRNLEVNSNVGGIFPGVLVDGELIFCKVSSTTGQALDISYYNMNCYFCEFISGAGTNGFIMNAPAPYISKFVHCKFTCANTYGIRSSSNGTIQMYNCEVNNTAGKAFRTEVGNRIKFSDCKLKGTLPAEIIQDPNYLSFERCEIISTGGSEALTFYNSAVGDFKVEFLHCKIIAPAAGTYSINNTFAANDKINVIGCLANKPLNNINGVTGYFSMDSNLKELI